MMLVWNNLADPHLSAFSHFAWFSRTVTLKIIQIYERNDGANKRQIEQS